MLMHCFFFLPSLTLPWTIAKFLDPFYTFSQAHRRVIRDFILPPLHTHVTDLRTPCHARGHLHTHTCDLGDTMPRQTSFYTYLGKQRISLG